MSEPKTLPSSASVADYLAAVPDAQRRADCQLLLAWMQAATGESPVLWGPSIVGFGTYRYTYASGRSGTWPVIGFAPRKTDLSIYIMPGFERFAALLQRLGRHKTGKSCLYIKRLADIDTGVLRELIGAAVAAMAAKRVTGEALP